MSQKDADALLQLALGPGDEASSYAEYTLGMEPEVRYYFLNATVMHYPGVGSPSHLLIWTRDSAHCFDYHQMSWASAGDLRL